MIRKTSIDVYNQINEEGLLSKRRWEVYKCLFHHGPLTANEVWQKLPEPRPMHHSITPRTAELFRLGVIKDVGERECKITGRVCIIWDVTDKLPVKMEKPKRTKCPHCSGRGYHEQQQSRMF